MKYFFVFIVFSFFLGIPHCSAENSSIIKSSYQSIKSAAALAADKIGETVTQIPLLNKLLFSNCVEPPKECPNENVTFWFYTRDTMNKPVKLNAADPASFRNLPKGRSPWHVIIHGYTKSKDEIPNPELRSAFFKQGEHMVISVDYAPLARNNCYLQAVHNVPLIANCTAQMLDALLSAGIFKSSDLHVIGFSLGAHVAGTTYKYMKHKKPQRVTGLDPASPLFDGVLHDTLTTDAADFVDVLHTNALMKGKFQDIGHVDFYFNGGISQPGCIAIDNKTFSTCNHDRSPIYYAESINSPDAFWGIPCNNSVDFYGGVCDTDPSTLLRMGENMPQGSTIRGTYFLETNKEPPYGLGKVSKVLNRM